MSDTLEQTIIKGNIIFGNYELAQFMRYLIDEADEKQIGFQFPWQGRVLITIEPTKIQHFNNAPCFHYWLKKHLEDSKDD